LESGGYAGERGVGAGADGLNGAKAHDYDEREHDGVFNCGRAIFGLEETTKLLGELIHGGDPLCRRTAAR